MRNILSLLFVNSLLMTNTGVCHVLVWRVNTPPGTDSSLLITVSPIAPSCLAVRVPAPRYISVLAHVCVQVCR